MANKQSNYEKYTQVSYSGRELLKKHSLSDTGTWQVFGEDPNCDFGGAHHNPFLGVFQGTLEDVIREVVELPGFWQWGYGGDIRPVTIRVASKANTEKRRALEAQISGMKFKVQELEQELAKL